MQGAFQGQAGGFDTGRAMIPHMAKTKALAKQAEDREIRTREAGEILGFLARGTVNELCQLGEANGGLKARKGDAKNCHWRISLQSVLDFPERQMKPVA